MSFVAAKPHWGSHRPHAFTEHGAIMAATYWEIGRRIVEFEQRGEKRAKYGKALLERLSKDLTLRYGRGFARPNLIRFRQF